MSFLTAGGVVLTILAPALFCAADTATRKDAKQGREALEGTWTIVSGESNGRAAPEDAFKDAKMKFAGDKLVASSENGKTRSLTFKIDPAGKIKTIDITHPEKKQTILGIYMLQANKLTLCLGSPGSARPTTFATREGSGTVLFVLSRDK